MDNLILLFPKVVYVNTLSSLSDDILDYCKNKISQNPLVNNGDGCGMYTQEQYFLDDPVLKDLKAEITQFVYEYVSVLNHKTENIRICSSWGTLLKNNEQTTNHRHANSYISGVFYLSEGSGISLHNTDPMEDFFFAPEVVSEKDKPWTYGEYNIPCQSKRILLFPSMMHHSVEKNNMGDRYSIAFNTVPVGNFGGMTCKVKF